MQKVATAFVTSTKCRKLEAGYSPLSIAGQISIETYLHSITHFDELVFFKGHGIFFLENLHLRITTSMLRL